MRVDPDKFLTEMNKLFDRTKDKGTVFLTMKRTAQKPKRSKVQPTPEDYKCLVRVSDGKRKISTVLAGKDLSRFQDSYSTLLKAHMDALKKRDRKAKKDPQ